MLELLEYDFFKNALIAVLLIAVSGGIIGTYIMTRRLVAISGGITHACFGGLGLGYFLGLPPVAMAAVVAVISSVGVEWASGRFRLREDSAIAVIWALGMAVGVLFVFMTPGYVPELNSFLFGNLLTVSRADLWAFSIFTAVLLIFFAWKYREIVACAFDRDFARVAGLPTRFITYIMTVFVALAIVLTIRMVGVMLLMSVLSLPIMTAELLAQHYSGVMWRAVVIGGLCSVGGLFLGSEIDIPCSAFIVIINVAVFIAVRAICAVVQAMHRSHR